MRIAHHLHHIFARIEFITAEVVAVRVAVIVRCKVVSVEGDRDLIAVAGLDQIRLGEADQHDVRLFDLARGIRSRHVYFYNFLARHIAGVGDIDGNGKFCILIGLPGKSFAVFKGHIRHFPIKGRVGEAVAEREHDIVVIPSFPVGKSARFIIAVPDVDALFVIHIVLRHGRLIAVCREVHVAARHEIVGEVFICRILREIAAIGIHRSAGGIDRTVEHSAERIDTGVSGAADPHAGVDLVGNVCHTVDERRIVIVRRIQETELHGSRRVDDDDNVIEIVAGLYQHVLLVLVQLEIMVVGIQCAVDRAAVRILHRAGEVERLAADTGNDDQRRVVVFRVAVLDRLGIARKRGLARFESGDGVAGVIHGRRCRSARTGLAVIRIEIMHDGVVFKARVFQALVQGRGVLRNGERAGTGTAVGEVDRVFAEHRNLGAFGERKSVILVL